ncbi:MAG: hypothetical protein JOZ97_08285 [Candidatus Eremiobacteraeota bacterium]|nr:hypothetical protein [Candidatus Eremiobacteraeota bacterium]
MIKKFVLVIAACSSMGAFALASDSGLQADAGALRALAARPHVTVDDMRVAGNYAVLHWIHPPAGGMSAYKRTSGHHWTLLISEGGVITASDLMKKGVPAATAHKLLSMP